MGYDLKALTSKLNPTCRKGLESAAELCVSQTNYDVEFEHLLLRLLEVDDTDITRILRHYDVNRDVLLAELTRAIDGFKRGNTRTPALSPHLPLLLQEAWLHSSLHLGENRVRSGALFLALLDHELTRAMILESCASLRRIPRDGLRQDLRRLIRGSAEDSTEINGKSENGLRAAARSQALDQYTVDLTDQARAGQIDPIVGRDAEIRQVIDILTRRRQNNPILTGEAGVGKTAVVEGFALRVVAGDVPPALATVSVRVLDLGLLQAGAGVKGEFENRLKSVIAEVKASPQPIILFIDEAHTLIGAGGAAGQGDAANLLKPALARGELRTVAATTWGEYKKYIEKDPALARRFQVVKVEEPTEEAAVEMLRGVAANLERHHGVHILDEAVRDAVRLSHRYISGRRLPDKAISVLDTACARVAVAQHATPAALEAAERRAVRLEEEIALLRRERATGLDHSERVAALNAELKDVQAEREALRARWEKESELAARIIERQRELAEWAAGDEATPPGGPESLAELEAWRRELAGLQGEQPMTPVSVDSRLVAEVLSGWTGIPVRRMLRDELRTVLDLKTYLGERIVGQDEALDIISRRIHTYRADLDDPDKPVGVFLLAGPSGVGKTETALSLAELLYGGERNLITINMSEYQEAHTVSALKGAPPGYVGYGKGGVLTEAVRRRPYSVVLLDEVEKAHPDVMEMFYQVFDKGWLEDSEGQPVDFRNTVILLTSNLGGQKILHACRAADSRLAGEELAALVRPELLRHFKPAFLSRLVVVPYYPLEDAIIQRIVRLKLGKVCDRFLENHRAALTYDETLVAAIAQRCTEVDNGARNVDHILTQSLLPGLSREVLERMAAGGTFHRVHVGLDGGQRFVYHFLAEGEEPPEPEPEPEEPVAVEPEPEEAPEPPSVPPPRQHARWRRWLPGLPK